jgi:glycosyltransferase involved in cell wall biosynthesis
MGSVARTVSAGEIPPSVIKVEQLVEAHTFSSVTMTGKLVHVITESQPFGGAQRNTLLTLKGLVRDGYAAELICGPGGPLISHTQALNIPVHVIPELIREVDPRKDCRALFRLYQLFRSRAYHIVHTHSTKAGLLGRLAARWAGVPGIVHTFHGVPFEMNGDFRSKLYIALERYVASFTHDFACVGESLKQEILSWQIAPDEKFVTIYSGIDFSSYIPKRTVQEIKRHIGIEEAWPIIGCVGRLSEQKAQHYLVEASAILQKQYPHLQLLLVGEGELRPLLQKRIEELALSSHVSLLGERDDIADLLNIFDIYAMSSLWEGVGRALTEAMYWKLPIVATPVNGVKELIVHEETGLLVPPRNPTALAAAIDRLASDYDLRKRLGTNARQKAEELMDGQQMIVALEELYQNLKRQ